MNESLELDIIVFFKIHYSYSCSMSFKYIRSDLYFMESYLISFVPYYFILMQILH